MWYILALISKFFKNLKESKILCCWFSAKFRDHLQICIGNSLQPLLWLGTRSETALWTLFLLQSPVVRGYSFTFTQPRILPGSIYTMFRKCAKISHKLPTSSDRTRPQKTWWRLHNALLKKSFLDWSAQSRCMIWDPKARETLGGVHLLKFEDSSVRYVPVKTVLKAVPRIVTYPSIGNCVHRTHGQAMRIQCFFSK